MSRKKSIKKTLLLGMIGLAVVITILSGTANALLLYNVSIDNMNSRISESATAYCQSVQNAIQTYKTRIEAIARDAAITDSGRSAEERNAAMAALASDYGFETLAVADVNGHTSDGADVNQREYFKEALAGTTYISSTLVSATTGKTVLIAAAKIDNGGADGVAIATLDSNTFSAMIDGVSIGSTGYGFIVDKDGKIIAHKSRSEVNDQVNYIETAKQDKSYAGAASVIKSMVSGSTGIQSCRFNGIKMTVSYTAVPDTDGWSIGISAKSSEMMGQFYTSVLISIILIVVFILLSVFVAFRIANPIVNPIIRLVARIRTLAEGDLHSEVPLYQSENEIGELSRSFEQTVHTLNGYVGEIATVLSDLKKGDCTVETRQEYQGDFVQIRDSLNAIVSNLNGIFLKFQASTEQVSSGAEQVSGAAQALSQGATEQASSVEELAASITEIASKVNKNAENAENASRLSLQASDELMHGDEQMKNMVNAMGEISDTSSQIAKIIKTIEDIAFQTNILSLNAAVEAARAGEAGKGFAVVADEVRNLANKSAEAAKNTTTLISNTILAVENGQKVADQTAESLNRVIDTAKKSAELIDSISVASKEQASAINQISTGVDQISAVVQTTSATSEESAATSEELSSQAQMVKSALAEFKLKNTAGE